MARVLIATFPRDVHALEVALALEDRGHEALLWYGSDFPTLQSASLDFRGAEVGWEVSGPGLEARPPFDTVWLRRPTPPVLPPDLHPSDLPVARRECRDFFHSLVHLAAPEAFWVNPLANRSRADLKAVQLREAALAGLTVSPTLMSNDPGRIRRFLDEHRGRAVYKPFYPAQWESDGDEVAVLLTSEVTVEDLPEDEVLRLTPGIFQARLEKSHELRATFFGEHAVTARLLSQELEAARVDWRGGSARLRVEPDRLPAPVEGACRRLMRSLGIVFGCFDFIVTPEGEHVFLEVNPSGQFLWVEEACPQLPVLAPFVDFLLAGRPDFRWPASSAGAAGPGAIRHADFYPAACQRVESPEERRHVPAGDPFVSREPRD